MNFPTVPSHTPTWMPPTPSHAPDPRTTEDLQREIQRLNKLDHDMLYQLYQIMIRRMTSPDDRKAVDAHNQLLIDIRAEITRIQSELARRTALRGGKKKTRRRTRSHKKMKPLTRTSKNKQRKT